MNTVRILLAATNKIIIMPVLYIVKGLWIRGWTPRSSLFGGHSDANDKSESDTMSPSD